MKDKLNNLKNKKYLLLFILVMVLNAVLTVTLLRVSFGQNKEDFSSQQPIKAEVMEQKGSPLRIVIVNVDNSALSHQEIICSLQNIGNKPIRAYTLLGGGKGDGKIITRFFATKLFQAGESEINSVPLERRSIKEGETILLSIDYIEFEDGSSWGVDSRGKSKALAGQREGTKAAIKQLKDLIKNQNANGANSVTNFLKQDLQEITVAAPDANQSDEWKRGFQLGYKSVISILQGIEGQKIEKLTKKLDEMEKIADKEGQIQ